MKVVNFFKKPAGLFIAVVVIGVAAWLAYTTWQTHQNQTITLAKPIYKTAQVKRGDIALTASGTGTTVPSNTVNLSFSVPGTVSQLNVQVGDRVTAGTVLATLGGVDQLKADVENKKLALQVAQQDLATLMSSGSAKLAQALSDQASAQAALDTAQKNLVNPGDPRCAKATTEDYYYQYLFAKEKADPWETALSSGKSGYGRDYILEQLKPLRKKRDAAYNNWKYCEGYTDKEITDSHANLALAQAKLEHAQAVYQNLLSNNGLDPQAVSLAQNTVKNTELQLTHAQTNLDGITLIAPIDGTVTAINGNNGENLSVSTTDSAGNTTISAGTSTFITLADLDHPLIQTTIDETDLGYFAAGCPAVVTFKSIPTRTFTGAVTSVNPQLVSVRNVATVQGVVQLDNQNPLPRKSLPIGMDASVDVTCNQAKNIILVPLEALTEPTGGQAYVFILNQQGRPEKRFVEVGLRNSAFAEIKNGLTEGESVITTPVNQ